MAVILPNATPDAADVVLRLRTKTSQQRTVSKMNAAIRWNLLIQVATTLAMMGLIWFVQIVHYPLMAEVGRAEFRRYEMEHQRLTTWLVAPLMLCEMASAVLLLWFRPAGIGLTAAWIGIVLLVFIWLITYTVQVPQHSSLVLSFDPVVQRKLVRGNWWRTVAWTSRGLLVLWMVARVIPPVTAIPLSQTVRSILP